MRNATLVLLVLVVGLLGILLYSKNVLIASQRSQIEDLKGKLDSKSKVDNIELQEKCSKQAQEAFRRDGFETKGLDWFTNHYSQKLNKCFVLYHTTDAKATPGTVLENDLLSDAFEGKVYGHYLWQSDKVKKSWEVPPIVCSVTNLSGEEQTCKSSDEFDALIRTYMEQ